MYREFIGGIVSLLGYREFIGVIVSLLDVSWVYWGYREFTGGIVLQFLQRN
jgi:hypothetical protein